MAEMQLQPFLTGMKEVFIVGTLFTILVENLEFPFRYNLARFRRMRFPYISVIVSLGKNRRIGQTNPKDANRDYEEASTADLKQLTLQPN